MHMKQWTLTLASSITPCIQGPPSPHCTATVDPTEKQKGYIFDRFSTHFRQ